MSDLYKIGWFSTGAGPASRELLTAVAASIKRGEIAGEIAFVFCNREPGESAETDSFLKLVKDLDIPPVCFSYRKFKAMQDTPARDPSGKLAPWRLNYDREVMDRLQLFTSDINVLAGYMLVTTPELCRNYDMINLHPAAPGGPAGTRQQVIWQLIGDNARETGALVHLVTPEPDKGPVISYCAFPIRGEPFDRHWAAIEGRSVADIRHQEGEENPLFTLIRRSGLTREIPLVTETIRMFSRGLVRINSSKIVVDTEDYPVPGYDLTEVIEEILETQEKTGG